MGNRQHFQIFPNSQRDWKMRWLSAEKELSNEQEGMKVGSWIFNPLRTVTLGCAAKLSLGMGTKQCFGFLEGPIILIQVLVGAIILGDLQTILQKFLKKVFKISFQEKMFIFLYQICVRLSAENNVSKIK